MATATARVFITAPLVVSSYAQVIAVGYDPSGALFWADQRAAAPRQTASLNDCAVDPGAGLVYVTGYASNATTNNDFVTLVSGLGGRYLGRTVYDAGFGRQSDIAVALAVDPVRGTVWVTGFSSDATGQSDFATVAYLR